MFGLQNKKIIFQHLNTISYKEAWDYQEQLHKKIVDVKLENRKLPSELCKPTPNYLLFCQHPHVYTLGKNGKESHLLLNNQQLEKEGIEFYKINRGGDITYHGFGQIVGYPIIDLANFKTDLGKYLRTLEEVIIKTIAEYGLDGYRIDGATGVWVGEKETPRKICAMGIRASRWVTMHGWALNINTDLSYFNKIIPCGIKDKGVTSLAEEFGYKLNVIEVEEHLKKHFSELFDFQIEEINN